MSDGKARNVTQELLADVLVQGEVWEERKVSSVLCARRSTTNMSNYQASADFCICVHPTPKLLLSPTPLRSCQTSAGNPEE